MCEDFAQAWACAEGIGGWLTRAQGRELWCAARAAATTSDALKPMRIVEIGSHKGRSTVVLASATRGTSASVVAVDPFLAGGRYGGPATRGRFEANLARAGLTDQVKLITERSADLRSGWTQPIAMLYIDGKHDYWSVRDDLRWSQHLPDGAPVLIHDAFSSIGVTVAVLVHVLPTQTLVYAGRTGSLARFTTGRPTSRDRLRILAELPWWLRNVLVKLVLRAGRLFGIERPDPY